MKQECPSYLKTIGKRKALTTTLSDTEPEDDSDNKDDGILNAFTVIVNSTEGIVEEVDEEENLVESKFKKNCSKSKPSWKGLQVQSLMKSYITRQFKKFMKNANAKGFDKDRKQSSSLQFKS